MAEPNPATGLELLLASAAPNYTLVPTEHITAISAKVDQLYAVVIAAMDKIKLRLDFLEQAVDGLTTAQSQASAAYD